MPGPQCFRTVTLHDGASVRLRPIAPEDKPLLVDMFERLSEQSRYRRFFMRLRHLSPGTLSQFTELDHANREAIIAIEPASGHALGVARYVRSSDDPQEAEVAVAVVDDWHRRGLGPALLAQLRTRAQQQGIRRFVAIVQASNRDALALADDIGASRLRAAGPNLELVIELPLREDLPSRPLAAG